MKKILLIVSLISLFLITGVYAQQRDTVKHKESEQHRMNRFIRQRLTVDSVKAEKINAIQDKYKASMKQVMGNGSLSENQKHRAMDSLVSRKNTALSALLTPEQQAKFIPSTERAKNKPADENKQ